MLASASPQRLALLERLGVRPSKLVSVTLDERPLRKETPRLFVARMAREKAEQARRQIAERGLFLSEGLCLLAADTAVVCARRILGKPCDEDQAREFLQKLSGRSHQVWTGVVVCNDRLCHERVRLTRVIFKRLTEREIADYVDLGEWRGSAGGVSYAGDGGGFCAGIEWVA